MGDHSQGQVGQQSPSRDPPVEGEGLEDFRSLFLEDATGCNWTPRFWMILESFKRKLLAIFDNF